MKAKGRQLNTKKFKESQPVINTHNTDFFFNCMQLNNILMAKLLKDLKFSHLNINWAQVTGTVKRLHSKQLPSFLHTTSDRTSSSCQHTQYHTHC